MAVEVTPPMLAEVQKPHGPGNPHPLHGVDPNIMNEFGHTHYPKWVNGVLCKDEKHEKEVLNSVDNDTAGGNWGK